MIAIKITTDKQVHYCCLPYLSLLLSGHTIILDRVMPSKMDLDRLRSKRADIIAANINYIQDFYPTTNKYVVIEEHGLTLV